MTAILSTRRCLFPTLLACVLLALALAPARAKEDGMLIHVSSGPDAPQRVLMAMKMGTVMATDHDVLMYFDIDGVKLLVKGAPVLTMEPFGSSTDLLAQLQAAGVTIMACPTCLKKAGKTPEDLIPGVKVADKAAFFTFTKGRIVTLDY